MPGQVRRKYRSGIASRWRRTCLKLTASLRPFRVSLWVAEGYINFDWLGAATFSLGAFLTVTFMQEILLRVRMGLLSFSLMAWYAYLSMSIAMTSVFATIVSFVHTYALIFCISSY